MLLVDTDVMELLQGCLNRVGLGVKLATFNGGDYRAVAALEVLRPYER